MDFTQNESQRELAALSRSILTGRLTQERLSEAEAGADGFDPGLWADLAGAGVLAAALPEALGGAGPGPLGQGPGLPGPGAPGAPVPPLPPLVLRAGAPRRLRPARPEPPRAAPARPAAAA